MAEAVEDDPVPVPFAAEPSTCRVTTLGSARAAIPATLSKARSLDFLAGLWQLYVRDPAGALQIPAYGSADPTGDEGPGCP